MKDFLAQWMPPDYSAHGAALDDLSAAVHWLMLILFVLWGAYFVYALFRFRASRNPKASYAGMKSHFSSYLETGVAVIEVVLLVGFSIPMWMKWTARPEASKNPLEVRVVAEQFAWNIQYPGKDGIFGRRDVNLVSSTNPLGLDLTDPHAKDDIVTLNQLHMEVNRPILIHLSSKDVIHSFFLPYMRVKQDAIPGQEVAIHFTPIKTGSDGFEIACAQLCGLGHYRMRGQYAVHNKSDFEKWLADNAPAAVSTSAPNPVPAATPAQNPATGQPEPVPGQAPPQ
ncbi:MAG TPA: hypothetical protein VGR95_04140 [Thermoanaerobaculia bacterium]|jgi:cytochrome c oxidase subunit 2|nr:hypothetical protein [Thermoanaerobaculia bacterium]